MITLDASQAFPEPAFVETSTLPYRELVALFHAADDAERAAHDACDRALEAELRPIAERLGAQVVEAQARHRCNSLKSVGATPRKA